MAAHCGWLWCVGTEIVHRLKRHDLMMMAAAIAFYWLLGLIPLLLLGTSAVGYLLGSSDRAVDDVMAAVSRLMPRATGPEVTQFLQGLIRSRRVTGALGIGILSWAAMGAFEIIASSLTTLTGGRETRSFLRRKLIALVLMCTAGLLLVAALMGSWLLAAWPNIQDLLGVRIALPALLADPDFPRYLASALMAMLLTIIYRVAPMRDLGWGAAAAGASVAAVSWHTAKLAFNWFVLHYSRINLFFGILGGFILLVLWIFYTAIILLFGGMLADILQQRFLPAKNLAADPVLREGA
ncbi:MAG TPA: YihY/virulence factor BrkB family protein [Candidatus Methylomirabilis sp.]|nr:YihY/virulence factor BrkB family protein [Candidatus Methylomirabilis sp.]HSC72300.1 YihY/virulence factor BrkB family protein [Candidatus Methylomirabilis sp.]